MSAKAPVPPAGPFPWTTVLAGGGSFLGMALVGVAVWAAMNEVGSTIGRRNRGRQAKERVRTEAAAALVVRENRLDLARARHDAVLGEWGAFELDLVAVFEAPLLTDVTVPQTAAFHEAFAVAEDDRLMVDRVVNDVTVDRYVAAVRVMETTWAVARAHATRVGHSHLAPVERRTLERVVGLLRKALAEGGTDPERQAFYTQAMYLVKGLVDVPRRTVLAVEEAHRLALPSGDGHRLELPVGRLVAGR